MNADILTGTMSYNELTLSPVDPIDYILSSSSPSSSASTKRSQLIEKLQKNADKVQKNIFDIEQNLNKVQYNNLLGGSGIS